MWVSRQAYPSYPRAARRRRLPPAFDRRTRRMGPLGVVEVDPLADDPFGREAVGQLVRRPPLRLDEDVAAVFEDARIPIPPAHQRS